MSLTVQDIATEVRQAISDEHAPYRWSDEKIVRYTGDGQRDLYNRRPSSVSTEQSIVTSEPTFPTALSSTLGTRDRYKTALVHYVDHRCLAEDSEDANNLKKAAWHYEQYLREAAA